jgi:hypothetical protein
VGWTKKIINPVRAFAIGLSRTSTLGVEGKEMGTKNRSRKAEPVALQATEQFSRETVERLAYEYWSNRGCPEGSAEEDWFQAEQALLAARQSPGHAEVRTIAAWRNRQGAAMKAAG